MALCLLGVVLVSWSQSGTGSNTETVKGNSNIGARLLGVLIILMAAWSYSTSSVLNRTLKGINVAVILNYQAILGTALTVVYTLSEHWISGNPFRVYTAGQYGQLACCCLADLTNIVC